MSDVKWIKLTTDMFDNRKIKALRRLPDGNNIVLIWVMLLTLAGRCNSNGLIFLTENIPYTPKMLADELQFEENTVKLALEALQRFGMIQTDGFLSITNWEKYQNVDRLTELREYNRLAQQRSRANRKQIAGVNDKSMTSQSCHETDIDIEEDKDKEKEKKEDIKPAKRFIPPTLEEVTAYCTERHNKVDPQHFIDHYASNGWTVGRNHMRDWKAAVRNWERNDADGRNTANGVSGKAQSKYHYGETI